MTQLGSINRDLETLARSAAMSLGVPFVTVTVGGGGDDEDAALAAKAVFADAGWAAAHGDIDLVGLDNASAVAQNIPFYACIPVRDEVGEPVGRVCCGASEERGLSDAEMGTLKEMAAEVAALVKTGRASPAFLRA
jgi:GAF domain-containing protein